MVSHGAREMEALKSCLYLLCETREQQPPVKQKSQDGPSHLSYLRVCLPDLPQPTLGTNMPHLPTLGSSSMTALTINVLTWAREMSQEQVLVVCLMLPACCSCTQQCICNRWCSSNTKETT